MENMRILFISIEGNTRYFVNKLTAYADGQHDKNKGLPTISATEISEQTDFTDEVDPYFCFVPTYLDGGNGIDTGVKELMTNVMGEYISFHNNARKLMGVVGSGNRNFNEQYCLTAKRYGKLYDAPFVADFELRGTAADEIRVYRRLVETMQLYEAK
ncbi:class Ib ribonucleoside-diphosphate reductase assembly flavoprotein NrdI [uncultured Secundilactobacillus sp.]|uniref:class Ib ribonucleoside-diphosphate reductase assembly flavoprotein NrdI n=1 Tax=uncultured Secundilactobacillus sp. TaxID=2813935 RepID=UPI0025879366|nr:class Ib ribonucleoside-diphosphate reductase assembly flavoprotein NrdI [uncultured Secundilactobacillus sp.]